MGIISRLLHRIRFVATKDHSTRQSVQVSSIAGFTPSGEAKRRILNGKASAGLRTDRLEFDHDDNVTCLPADLIARQLIVENCPDFERLPQGLWCDSVSIDSCERFSEIPVDIHLSSLSIRNCTSFTTLPAGLKAGKISVENCPNLLDLPERFHFESLHLPASRIERILGTPIIEYDLDLEGASRLLSIPNISVSGELILSGCTSFEWLPDQLVAAGLDLSGCLRLRWQEFANVEVDRLNISDCVQITHLPAWLTVTSSIDVANTGLKALPEWCAGLELRWRGVKVDERIAFHPETICCDEVIAETNIERRRVMLERIGWENFLMQVDYEIIDGDTDPGGERKLLSFRFSDEDELRVLAVCCPSTKRRYFIRVPPHILHCHAAAAWIAGFDNPDDYCPIKET